MAVLSGGSEWVSRRWDLVPEPESAGVARVLVRSACADWEVDGEVREDALLVISELVSNVVDHAGTRCQLSVGLDGAELRIEVRDFYRCPPPRLPPMDPSAPRGRGLQVVSAVSMRWGVTAFDDGKSVWAVLPVPTGAAAPPAGCDPAP